ncbi:MAG: MaoC family dehydratase [Bacteroidales bacterium]|nr:MaoC family dehydratase [Bacteroidales bacterium]MBN2817436.1 MaoC family dehydratase [Bacteroidales bacterium]
MSKVVINSHAEFEKFLGKLIGYSDYLQITQEQINMFADATLDHQWIHIDSERAKKESQFGDTIAHGYLTLSLLPYLWEEIVDFRNIKMMVNYGIEDLKFQDPVKVNSKVRLKAELTDIKNLRGITKTFMKATLEIDGSNKPAFVATVVFIYHFEQ